MTVITDDNIIVAMEAFGGSFVQALAGAYRCADLVNQARIREAFPDLWVKYRELATMIAARQGGR